MCEWVGGWVAWHVWVHVCACRSRAGACADADALPNIVAVFLGGVFTDRVGVKIALLVCGECVPFAMIHVRASVCA